MRPQRVPMVCAACGLQMLVKPSDLKTKRYCSRRCMYAHRAIKPSSIEALRRSAAALWRPLSERVERMVDRTDGCWIWTGHVGKRGYGTVMGERRKPLLAHRVMYEKYVGPIPDGLQLDHLCRNRKCVNPKHLEPVTTQENTRRGWVARRQVVA